MYFNIYFEKHITIYMKVKLLYRYFFSNKLYVGTYTLKKKEVEMNVTRTFMNEGKKLQELMEILLPIYIQEKTYNINEEEVESEKQKILK